MVSDDALILFLMSIFQMDDLRDIPPEIKKGLLTPLRNKFEENIIELFKTADRQLDLDEVTVAYYRLYKEKKTRKQIMSKLYNMSRSNTLESVKGSRGVYKLAKIKGVDSES